MSDITYEHQHLWNTYPVPSWFDKAHVESTWPSISYEDKSTDILEMELIYSRRRLQNRGDEIVAGTGLSIDDVYRHMIDDLVPHWNRSTQRQFLVDSSGSYSFMPYFYWKRFSQPIIVADISMKNARVTFTGYSEERHRIHRRYIMMIHGTQPELCYYVNEKLLGTITPANIGSHHGQLPMSDVFDSTELDQYINTFARSSLIGDRRLFIVLSAYYILSQKPEYIERTDNGKISMIDAMIQRTK